MEMTRLCNFANTDFASWVEQHVWRKVYIALRIEATISCHKLRSGQHEGHGCLTMCVLHGVFLEQVEAH